MEVFQQKFVEEAVLSKGFQISVSNMKLKFKLLVNGQVADLVAKAHLEMLTVLHAHWLNYKGRTPGFK